jgi:hypothetical protein
LPDGSYWSGAWGMTRQMDDASLLFTAASSSKASTMAILWQTLRYTARQRTTVDRTRLVQADALPGT